MSGVVIDDQQWEHCHSCNGWVKSPQNLGYTEGYAKHICIHCVQKLTPEQVAGIIPAPSWTPVYERAAKKPRKTCQATEL